MRDITLAALLLGSSALWAVAGYRICTARHRQRGMEVDNLFDSPMDLMPGPFVPVPDSPRELVDA